VISLH